MSATSSADTLKSNVRRWTLILGVLQITVGCVIGFIPPTAVQWFRGIVMAHIEFTANGVLVIVLGLLVKEFRLPAAALWVWFLALQIGSWTNGGAGILAAFTGASSRLMPTTNEKFPPPNGADSALVTGVLMICGVTILAALFLTLVALLRSRPTNADASA